MSYPRENSIVFDAAPAVNIAAVATSPNPGTDRRLRLKYVAVSYSAAPTGGLLTITDGVFTWKLDVGATPLLLPNLDLQCAPASVITITLAAAGAAVQGRVNAYATAE